jgi:hypothetical protein
LETGLLMLAQTDPTSYSSLFRMIVEAGGIGIGLAALAILYQFLIRVLPQATNRLAEAGDNIADAARTQSATIALAIEKLDERAERRHSEAREAADSRHVEIMRELARPNAVDCRENHR